MINTLSICSHCYKRVPAKIVIKDSGAWMVKCCPVHGEQEHLVDPDPKIIFNYYNTETVGINKAILVPITDKCNMNCTWCFTSGVKTEDKPSSFYDSHLIDLKVKGYSILLSGGEPTIRPDFLNFCYELSSNGWPVVTMSNMLKFADLSFMQECRKVGIEKQGILHADFSMQHPKNYSGEVAAQKYSALANLEKLGLKANCIQFSVSDLEELKFIRSFYNDTKHLYQHIRIRTLFGFWKDESKKIYLSQLLEEFRDQFGDLTPTQSEWPEKSNIYSIYMRDANCGISLSSAPTVHNVDLLSARRPTYGWARDEKYYSFPVAQIINEGIEKGWYNGFKINQEVSECSSTTI